MLGETSDRKEAMVIFLKESISFPQSGGGCPSPRSLAHAHVIDDCILVDLMKFGRQ